MIPRTKLKLTFGLVFFISGVLYLATSLQTFLITSSSIGLVGWVLWYIRKLNKKVGEENEDRKD